MRPIQEQSPVMEQLLGQVQEQQPESLWPQGGSKPRVTFREAIRMCWDRYTDFDGRSRRSEYWWFFLFTMLVFLMPLLPLGILYHTFDLETAQGLETLWVLPAILLGIALVVAVLILICPIYAVMTRRLHDVGRSGWWIVWDIILDIVSSIVLSVAYGRITYAPDAVEPSDFTMLKAISESSLPMIVVAIVFFLYLAHASVSIVILVFTLLDSHKGENKYGPSPKYQTIESE